MGAGGAARSDCQTSSSKAYCTTKTRRVKIKPGLRRPYLLRRWDRGPIIVVVVGDVATTTAALWTWRRSKARWSNWLGWRSTRSVALVSS